MSTTRSNSRNNSAPSGVAAVLTLAAVIAAYWEGFSPTGYADPVGIPTVCWGHTGPDVRVGMTLSLSQCRDLLQKDLVIAASAVERCITRPLSTHQAAAFTSFTFNVGGGAFCGSTLVRLFNAGQEEEACRQMSRWIYAKGVKLRGLERRRAAEVSLCLNGSWTPPDGRVPTSPLGKAGFVPHVVATVGVDDVGNSVLDRAAERGILPVVHQYSSGQIQQRAA